MAKIAILGAAGGLGSACVAASLQAGHETRALLRTERPGLLPSAAHVLACDARDAQAVMRASRGCDALLYCVNTQLSRWVTDLPLLMDNAIAACRATGARLVFPGNVWSYGAGKPGVLVDETRALSPTSVKGALRARLEQQLARSGIAYVIARLPEFYGPNVANPLMGAPFRSALAGSAITWLGGRLDVVVEYAYVPDAASAMLELALASDVVGQTFHIPAAAHTTPRRFWGLVQTQAGSHGAVRSAPPWALRAVALVAPQARQFVDILHLWTDPILLDGTRYRARFGRVPATDYADGIARTLEWFREHPHAVNAN